MKTTTRVCLSVLVLLCWSRPARVRGAPEEILLWPDGAPGAVGEDASDRPTITIYSPEAGSLESGATKGPAVVICPGGGYGFLAMSYEGHDVAKWFNSFGVTGVVL